MTRPGSNHQSLQDDNPSHFIGRVVNGIYRIEESLEVGGMGMVFRATRLNFRKPVAIKILRPSLVADTDINQRFQREIDVLVRLEHPNIVSILDVGRDASGFSYFVMEFVKGKTLAELCELKTLSLAEIFEIFRQVCSALSEAHDKGIIHRDIKFENILIQRLSDGRPHVTILDFGVARNLDESGTALTRVGELPGTPGIIAPELVDDPLPTPASDLYSVGVLLFTAITGQAPFKGANDLQLVRAHQTEPIPDIRTLVDSNDVPEQVIELIYELMQKDPLRRPQSAAEVRDRIEAIVRNTPRVDVSQSWNAYSPPKSIEKSEVHDLSVLVPEKVNQASVTPASIVGMLIAVMIVLVLIVCYLLYIQMFKQ